MFEGGNACLLHLFVDDADSEQRIVFWNRPELWLGNSVHYCIMCSGTVKVHFCHVIPSIEWSLFRNVRISPKYKYRNKCFLCIGFSRIYLNRHYLPSRNMPSLCDVYWWLLQMFASSHVKCTLTWCRPIYHFLICTSRYVRRNYPLIKYHNIPHLKLNHS